MSALSFERAPARPDDLIGITAALAAVLIWAGWIVATRHAVTHSLSPAATGLLRFAVPAVVFAPVLLRTGLVPSRVSWATLLGLMGAGAPFFVIVAYAMQDAPAADIGPLLPGTMPMFVALIAVLMFGARPGRLGLIGLLLIALGIAAIGGRELFVSGDAWLSHVLLLVGALMWATYTHAFKRSGLSAFEAAAIVAAWSTIMLLPFGGPSLWWSIGAGLSDVVVQTVVQGVLSGVIAIVLYGTAVSRLGAARASMFVALVPALATLLAIPVLGEWPDAAAVAGIVVTALGVTLAAGAFDTQRGRPA